MNNGIGVNVRSEEGEGEGERMFSSASPVPGGLFQITTFVSVDITFIKPLSSRLPSIDLSLSPLSFSLRCSHDCKRAFPVHSRVCADSEYAVHYADHRFTAGQLLV